MIAFALLELWNDYCEDKREGCTDFWESFITFIPGQGVLALLQVLSIINIGWWHGWTI